MAVTTLSVGFGGLERHACAALADSRAVLGVCEQERVTRVRGAVGGTNGIPEEALDALLMQTGRSREEIRNCAVAEDSAIPDGWRTVRYDHHQAHSCTAYLTSPFDSAAILVCDHEWPGVSVWMGNGTTVSRIEWPWSGTSFSDLYGECAELFGFAGPAGVSRFEALGRLQMAEAEGVMPRFFSIDDTRLSATPHWAARVREALPPASDVPGRARIAAALQSQIGSLVIDLLRRLRARVQATRLCLGGSLFYHTSINTLVKQSGVFERVFIPANPGNPGLSVGGVMQVSGLKPRPLSPYLGPCFAPSQIKKTLDNCKLRYDWLDEGPLIELAVRQLQQGRLVGWYEGRMEWGPRALGARSILASPFSPYVLENLNHFLKHREPWRGYAVSMLGPDVAKWFSGPDGAPFMECDYRPLDPQQFRHVMPSGAAHLRLHTVTADAPPLFRAVLTEFGRVAGVPCLVNTSFNGFHEPIVCTPRDALRVFFGTGLDVLILDRFVLSK